MLNVSEATKNVYRDFGYSKTLTITISSDGLSQPIVLTNQDIVAQSLQITEIIESENNLTFKGCNASVLKFKCRDLNTDVKGAKISCIVSVPNTDTIPLFNGYIDESSNGSHEQETMDITAYDILYRLSSKNIRDWYDDYFGDLVEYTTLKQFRDMLFSYIGVEQENVTLPNDEMLIYKTLDDDKEIYCTDMLRYICQINGRFGMMGRDEKFKYVDLNDSSSALLPSSSVYPSSSLYPNLGIETDILSRSFYSSIDFEGYQTTSIGSIELRDRDDTTLAVVGIQIEFMEGGSNLFTISGNPLIWDYPTSCPPGMLDYLSPEEIAQNILDAVSSIIYYPVNSLNLVGLPYLECGDYLIVEGRRSTIGFYILQRTLTGSQALKDKYEASGDKYWPVPKFNYREEADTALNIAKQAKKKAEDAYEGVSTVQEEVSDLSEVVETKQDILTPGTGIDMSNNTLSVTNPITYGTTDIGVGAPLATGTIYFVYEA